MSRQHIIELILIAIATLGILLTLLLATNSNRKNQSGAAPVTSPDVARWTNPCYATRNFSSGDLSFPEVPEFEKIQRIQETLLPTKSKSENLKTKIAKERLRNSKLELSLETMHMENFPNTSISSDDLELYKRNATLAYIRSYRDLSVVAVFLEAIREDEETFEHGSWIPSLRENEEQLYRLLCEVHNAIIISGATIDYESRDIMPDKYRNMSDRLRRYVRDYIVFKDTVTLFQSILYMNQVVLGALNSSA